MVMQLVISTLSNSFNEYFLSVAEIFSNEAHNKLCIDTRLPIDYLFSSFTKPIPSSNMKFTPHIEFEKIIKSLKYSNALGYVETPTKIINACADTISLPLVYTGVPGGKDLTSGECSLGQTIPI
jgi:hypothetical protein